MADAPDLGSGVLRRVGSNPTSRTTFKIDQFYYSLPIVKNTLVVVILFLWYVLSSTILSRTGRVILAVSRYSKRVLLADCLFICFSLIVHVQK